MNKCPGQWNNPRRKWKNYMIITWRHNGRDGVSNHQPHDCLVNRLFRRRSKKRSKLRVTGLCVGNSPVTGEFPTQMASNAKNVSIWWRHRVVIWLELLDETWWCIYVPMKWIRIGFVIYSYSLSSVRTQAICRLNSSPSGQNDCQFDRRHFQVHFLEWNDREFRFKFHWNLFRGVQLTIIQRWFR